MLMKEIPLTKGRVAFVDDEDFERVNQFGWCAHSNGYQWYAVRNVLLPDGRRVTERMHRFVMGLRHGDPRQVDHKDRAQTLDNRRSNLRATLNQNQQNQGKRKNNTSGFKGVHKTRGKWQARITVNSRLIHLGLFLTPEVAARAYDATAMKYHADFAVTNKMLAA
jgi:hypothetical protein